LNSTPIVQPRHFQLLLRLLDGKAEIKKKKNSFKLVRVDYFKAEKYQTLIKAEEMSCKFSLREKFETLSDFF
jgi:hypothetical protein